MTPIGWLKSSRLPAPTRTVSTSQDVGVEVGGGAFRLLVSRARAWASTIGSLSTYTTRAVGAAAWATSCVLFADGRPVPMSRNWRMPSVAAR